MARRFLPLLLALGLSLAAQTAWAKTYVLAVGIDHYALINDLRFAQSDAKRIAAGYAAAGADVTLVQGAETTHANLIAALRRLAAAAGSGDSLVFFFSGHGYPGGLCCYDMSAALFAAQAGRGIAAQSKAQAASRYTGGMSYIEIQMLLRGSRARAKLVMADACYSGGLKTGLSPYGISVRTAQRGAVAFLLSCRPDETSLELQGEGLFTRYLLEGLFGNTGAATPGDPRTLYTYVSERVQQTAAARGHSQHPVLWGKDYTPQGVTTTAY